MVCRVRVEGCGHRAWQVRARVQDVQDTAWGLGCGAPPQVMAEEARAADRETPAESEKPISLRQAPHSPHTERCAKLVQAYHEVVFQVHSHVGTRIS